MLYYARGVVRPAALALIAVTAAGRANAEDRPGDLVEVQAAIPDAVLERATEHNFTGAVLYPNAVCKLRRAVVERLAKAAALLYPLSNQPL